jgi:hypothetical protein
MQLRDLVLGAGRYCFHSKREVLPALSVANLVAEFDVELVQNPVRIHKG